MKQDRFLWGSVIIGLIPWGAAAIFTDWFNEGPEHTLSRAHALLLVTAQIGIPLAIWGVVGLWKRLFWERVPITGPSGIQQIGTSGPLWEYRRKKS